MKMGQNENPNEGLKKPSKIPDRMRQILYNPTELRPGWRLLIYSALVYGLMEAKLLFVQHTMQGLDEITRYVIGHQALRFVVCLLAGWIMTRIEGRTISDYGLPWRKMFQRQFWQGTALGFGALTLLLAAMFAFGVFTIERIGLSLGETLQFAALYGIIFIIIALSEEFYYRGYGQYTLSLGIGFWPAALLLSCYFGYSHIMNSGESWVGVSNVAVGGVFFCLLLQRSGNLWMPIGFHTGWNWGQTFFYGTPNSGQVIPGHFLNSKFSGAELLTGGTVGPEGSLLTTILFIIMFLAFVRWLPDVKYPEHPLVHQK